MAQGTWTADDMKGWRANLEWSQSQAAHALGTTRRTVIAWESDRPIGEPIVYTCLLIALLKGPHAKGFKPHFPDLVKRIAEADDMPGRGRPRGAQEG